MVLGGALVFATIVSSSRDHDSFENGTHTACCVYRTPSIAGLSAALGASASLSGLAGMYLSLLAGSNLRALIYIGRAVVVIVLQVRMRRAYCIDRGFCILTADGRATLTEGVSTFLLVPLLRNSATPQLLCS